MNPNSSRTAQRFLHTFFTTHHRLYHDEVPIETISKFLGHGPTVKTLKYLGINLDDIDADIELLDKHGTKMSCNSGAKLTEPAHLMLV